MRQPHPTGPHEGEVVGVYHAEGSLLGELRYAYGRLRGTAHCALCDITHATVRRKPEWDALVARLRRPVRLVHLDEMDDEVASAVAGSGSPVVLVRRGGVLVPVLDASALEAAGGSVAAFEAALLRALDEPVRSPEASTEAPGTGTLDT